MKKHETISKKIVSLLKLHAWRILVVCLISALLFLFPAPNKYFKPVKFINSESIKPDLVLPSPALFPKIRNGLNPPPVSAEGVLIKDLPSGVTLYAKNENVIFAPASTTKIMTALVALNEYGSDEVVKVTGGVKLEGRNMGLREDEEITVETLIYGALVHSANDASYELARHYSGGLSKFVDRMNETAASFNLKDTHFTNPIGFDNPNQFTTALDLAKLAQIALTNPTFAKVVKTKAVTVSDVTSTYFHDLKNVNELLGKVSGIMGVKTGYTEIGGEILITEVKRSDKSVLFVVLKSQDRFNDTIKLINWVFDNYQWHPIEELIESTH